MRDRKQRLAEQDRVLVELARLDSLARGDLSAALREITEAAARAVDVSRVMVWLFSEDRSMVRCGDRFDLADGTHYDIPPFETTPYPEYVGALRTERVIVTPNARTDPKTRAFADQFFTPFGITSLLDAPLRIGKRIYGVLSFCHRGRPRRWSVNEQRFAASLADLIAVAIQSAERSEAEEALRESEWRFAQAFEHAPIGMALVGLDRHTHRVNHALCRMFGYSEPEMLALPLSRLTHPGDLQLTMDNWERITTGAVDAYEFEKRYVHRNGSTIWARVSVSLIRDQAQRPKYVVTQVQDMTAYHSAQQRMTALLDVARDISGTLDRATLLDRVQRRTAAVLPCDGVATFFRDERRPVFRLIAHHGVPADVVFDPRLFQFPPGTQLSDRLTEGEAIAIDEVANQDLIPRSLLDHFGIHALVATPLMVRGGNMGALFVFNTTTPGGFTASQVELCGGIARQLGVAIEAADLHREQQEQAQVTTALAWVGREMMKSLDRPVLLQRLGQLTVEALGCDCSHTLLWRPEDDAFVPISQYGQAPEHWETIQLVKISRDTIADVLARLDRHQVVQLPSGGPSDAIVMGMAAMGGITRILGVALRREGEVIGLHAASYCGRQEPFSQTQERMAMGFAQMASLALENARLVEELARADRLKSEFVATMSHELRTPLNVILGYNDLLLDGAFGPLNDEQMNTLQRMGTSSRALLELVNAILQLSRLQSGRLPVDVQDLAIGAFVANLDEETKPLRQKPDLHFAWDIPANLPSVRTDPLKLKIVLKNLISNATKFTASGNITVAARLQDRGVEFSVTDTGPGIAPEVLPIIFEPFRQADASITRRYGGVGLGLFIVDRLVDTLGGKVSVESVVDRGSCFRVWIPLHPRQLPTPKPDSEPAQPGIGPP